MIKKNIFVITLIIIIAGRLRGAVRVGPLLPGSVSWGTRTGVSGGRVEGVWRGGKAAHEAAASCCWLLLAEPSGSSHCYQSWLVFIGFILGFLLG